MIKKEKYFPHLIRRVQRNTPLKQLLNRIMIIYSTKNDTIRNNNRIFFTLFLKK